MGFCRLRRNPGAVLLLCILTLFFPSCINHPSNRPIEEEKRSELLEFRVVPVSYREIRRDVEGLGNLAIHGKATVISRIDGVVEAVFVKKGDRVEEGDKLLKLSNYQLELEKLKIEKEVLSAEEELETAKLQYMEEEKSLYKKFLQIEKLDLQIENYEKEIEFMRRHLKRKKILYDRGGITEEELRNLEFSLDSREGELAILGKEYDLQSFGFRDNDLIREGYAVPEDIEKKRRLLIFINTKLLRKRIEFSEIKLNKVLVELERVNWLLEYTTVTAPVGGVVTDISKFIGEKISADEAVTTILVEESLIARVSFSETNLLKLEEGQEVTVYVDSVNAELRGFVHAIDPYVDVHTRSFSVDCLVDNSMNLVPGMFVRVKIPVESAERYLLIPREAFFRVKDNTGYVYIVARNSRIFKRAITYEEFDNESVIVTEGLNEGDTIVENPLLNLMDGTKISFRRN